MARKIGKNAKKAKKYADLRAKQKLANEMLYGAKNYLNKDHSAIKNALQRKKKFYSKRGLKNPPKLSFKNLTVKDLPMYEQLLDSIINNTYLNPLKYQQHIDKLKENTSKQILDAFGGNAEEYDSFLESDVFKQLIDMGVNPSNLINYMEDFYTNGFDLADFIAMSRAFMQETNAGSFTVDDFFIFADSWQDEKQNKEPDDTFKEQAKAWYEKSKKDG